MQRRTCNVLSALVLLVLLSPFSAFAVSTIEERADSLLITSFQIISYLIVACFSLAVAYFFYGLGRYILNASSEDVKEQSKSTILYGLIGMFVLFSVWGIIRLLATTFEANGTRQEAPVIDTRDPLFNPRLPTLPSS